MRPRRSPFAVLSLLPLLCACSPGDTRFASRTASGFAPQGHTVSVFGVYKEGLMSPDAWETMRPRVSPALGGDTTDDLIAQLAPAAKGDLIVVLTYAGQVGLQPAVKTRSPVQADPRRAGGGRRRTTNVPVGPAGNDSELDLSASFYSVADRKPVGLVTMQYTGATLDDALAKFTGRLASMLPGARCGGWEWTASIDPEAIRRSIDP
jgi:hypothetical protein